MATQSQLSLPHPDDAGRRVFWTGKGFDVDGVEVPVLGYEVGASGWTDELTEMHEDLTQGTHFIEVASRGNTIRSLKRVLAGLRAPAMIAEVGVSSGFLMRDIVAAFPQHTIVGCDYTYDTLRRLSPKVPGVPLVRFDLTRAPFDDASLDVVVLNNVLEHIESDSAALAQILRMLKPGGHLLLEVPAGASLFDAYDRALMHYRRYDMPKLTSLLSKAGFEIERRSHLGFLMHPAFYLSKRLNQMKYGDRTVDYDIVSSQGGQTSKLNGVMNFLFGFERWLGGWLYLPFGARCIVRCRKPLARVSAG